MTCVVGLQKEVLKKMGNSIPQNFLYGNVKMLMERVAPVMIDATAIVALLKFIEEAVDGVGEICEEIPKPIESGMKLLLVCLYFRLGNEIRILWTKH